MLGASARRLARMKISSNDRAAAARVAAALATAMAGAALVFLLCARLGDVPGLHGDEAWFALRALEMTRGESPSWHGMNEHSGGIYPYLVSLVFRGAGVSVLTLRLPSVALAVVTIATLAGLAALVGRGAQSALRVILLAAGSILLTGEWRLAWEVTALGPFLAALALLATAGFLRAGEAPRTRAAWAFVLFAASIAGVVNHFIFLALLLALAGASLALVALRARGGAAILIVTSSNLLVSGAIALVKLVSFERAWVPPAWGWLLVLIAAGESIAASALLGSDVVSWVERVVQKHDDVVRGALLLVFGAGGMAFAGYHGLAFVETLANDVVVQRLTSRSLPRPVGIASLVFAIALLGLYGRALARLLRSAAEIDPAAAFLSIVPLATMAALPVLIRYNSIRYYILPHLTLMLAVAIADPLIDPRAARWVTPALAVHAFALAAAILPTLLEPRPYDSVVPRRFPLGRTSETSAHFLPTADVHARLCADGATALKTDERWFLGLPLRFYRAADGRPPLAEGGRRAAILRYAYDRPGGLAYTPPSGPGR
jgi:hypothetical protein